MDDERGCGGDDLVDDRHGKIGILVGIASSCSVEAADFDFRVAFVVEQSISVASRMSRNELMTETTLLSITLRLAGDVTILEIS